ncbi:class I SAM-dependent methyltransferase [Methyloceanibacter sp.]|uniref:class I SAM-dependent methyltransferase n=1 Tax=Methyloceanibacter sp. TaxID=1965321 RepID=UPI003D6D71BF
MDTESVRHAYRRWAPVYDYTFGRVAEAGRKHAVKIINSRKGRVLEVGVGTGLSLSCYEGHLAITGIDLSPEMLEKAREKVTHGKLANIEGLHEMDASALAFPDESFDTVVAMYVMTVVPDPDKVMRELERVCAPGGEVILVNHFSQEEGVRGLLERKLAPFADLIGWHAVFEMDRVLVCEDLRLAERRALRPFGLFTMLRFVKEPGYGIAPQRARAMIANRGRAPVRAPLGEPARVRLKWAVGRGLVHARRLLDTNYWRSLYRRLQSQLAE